MKPSKMARISIVRPMVQFSSRGLRKAPVKKMRPMCTTIDAGEDVGRPVVHLADEQAAPHVEGDVDRRLVGRRHPLAPQGHVGAVVVRTWFVEGTKKSDRKTPVASTTTNE